MDDGIKGETPRMRALRVVIADGGVLPRTDLAGLAERAGFDVLGESPDPAGVAELVASRAGDLVLIGGDADFARSCVEAVRAVPCLVAAPDARATKEYADSGAAGIVMLDAEPEVAWSTASVAVARFTELHSARKEIDKLKELLETRKVVERAKGVLMRRLGVDEDEAYRKIQRASQDENRRMREIAESILSAERLYEPGQDGAAASD